MPPFENECKSQFKTKFCEYFVASQLNYPTKSEKLELLLVKKIQSKLRIKFKHFEFEATKTFDKIIEIKAIDEIMQCLSKCRRKFSDNFFN